MLEQSVMFPAPTFADEPMQFSAKLRQAEGSEVELSLEVKRVNDGQITCQGHCKVAP
jgi:acyl-CoA thioesterase FadM